MRVTVSSARRLDAISRYGGVVVGAAVDHRDSLQAVLRRRGIDDWSDERLSAFKLLVARTLAPAASVILLDVEYAAAQALASGALPHGTALAVPLEAQGYEQLGNGPATTLLEDWDEARSAKLGADACKLLLPFRTDRPEHAARQEQLATGVAERLHAVGLALILEPIVFSDPGAPLTDAELGRLAVDGAQRLRATGADVLKVQYPGSFDACREMTEACGTTPWVLLGGGADRDAIEQQVRDACSAGASGFVIGRTLFNDAIVPDVQEAEEILRRRSLPLLRRLAAIAQAEATPWRKRVGPIAIPPIGWHREEAGLAA